ncbi:hypothetical protein B1L04_14270 [Microcystis aeruginosa KW]|uniref:Uncharacterized protein n=1 Tax=Microcystis aeruginosa KW TaxID=1960155 RepID=A0A1V4BS06_MICAE|nr:hypothetical protein B1L04_14270 [Microcystis aeruginosa KW]
MTDSRHTITAVGKIIAEIKKSGKASYLELRLTPPNHTLQSSPLRGGLWGRGKSRDNQVKLLNFTLMTNTYIGVYKLLIILGRGLF